MEAPVTPKKNRPGIQRSHSAYAQISPEAGRRAAYQHGQDDSRQTKHHHDWLHHPQQQLQNYYRPLQQQQHAETRQQQQQRQYQHQHPHHPVEKAKRVGRRHSLIAASNKLRPNPNGNASHNNVHHHSHESKTSTGSRTPGGSSTSQSRSRNRSDSRRESPAKRDSLRYALENAPAKPTAMRPVRPEDVQREQENAEKRNEELCASLNTLSDLAHDSTRRLDMLYYAVLEKFGSLTSTIGSLQELSRASRRVQQQFDQDIHNLQEEMDSQMRTFGSFNTAEKKIEALDQRIKSSMERTQELHERLMGARAKVESWEEKEKKWQAKTSRRLAVCWRFFVMILFILATLLIFKYVKVRKNRVRNPFKLELDSSNSNLTIPDHIIDYIKANAAKARSSALAASESLQSLSAEATSRDRRLDVFDEL